MSLEMMKASGQLVEHTAGVEQIKDMLEVAQRCMNDVRIDLISRELRFTLAYEVIFHCATIILYTFGYRVAHKFEGHYLTIETLRYTLKIDKEKLSYFQRLRRKRHKDKYEGKLIVSEKELREAIREAENILKSTKDHLNNCFSSEN